MKETPSSARLECPGCGSSSFITDHRGRIICEYCHAAYVLPGRVCLECGAAYDPGARYCPSCGAELVRECRACGALNPSSVRRCMVCGQNLDMLESLFARATGETAGWLHQIREDAATIKTHQEAASDARLAEMWAVEARRREALAQVQAERDRQERIIIAVAVATVAIFIITALIVLAIAGSGSIP